MRLRMSRASSTVFRLPVTRCQSIAPEVVVLHACGDDQVVVGDDVSAFQQHVALIHVDRIDMGGQDTRPPMSLHDSSQGGGYIAGRQAPCGHLVQQGLKQMEIALVDQRDSYVGFAQDLGRVESAKTPTDDHDMVVGCLCGRID